MRKALLASAVAAGLVLTGGIGYGAYAALDKTVTLSIDGKAREVHTLSGSVGDLLAEEGVKVGDRDVVAPGPSTGLADGTRVAVRYARQLHLTVDGERVSHWTTAADVDSALDQLGLRYAGARFSTSRSAGIARRGLAVDVRTRKDVTVAADGKRLSLTTTGLTVAEALGETDLRYDGDDRISPALSHSLVDGATITLTRIEVKKRKVEVELPYDEVREEDADLYEDEEEVDQDGVEGLKVETRREVYVNGRRARSTVIDSEVVREPVDEVVRYGTQERPEEESSGSSGSGGGGDVGGEADSLNWPALAECESGGNPTAVNPAGYYGLYQFSIPTWESVGGAGNPADASPDEQTYRAKLLYEKAGAGQWPVCGQYLFS